MDRDVLFWGSAIGLMVWPVLFLFYPEHWRWVFSGLLAFYVGLVVLDLWTGRMRRRALVRAALRARSVAV